MTYTDTMRQADTLTGLLIDLNDGLYDEYGTRAEDAKHELQTRGYRAQFTTDHAGNTGALGYYVSTLGRSITARPDATVVYDGQRHISYPPERTEAAIYHFVRLVTDH